jgi:hypothetical protein
MRKNDLINELKALRGNPQILLYSGITKDYNHISGVYPSTLVKPTFERYLEDSQLRTKVGEESPKYEEIMRDYKKEPWSDNPHVTDEHIKQGSHKKKTVVYLLQKARGLTAQDRLGNVDY